MLGFWARVQQWYWKKFVYTDAYMDGLRCGPQARYASGGEPQSLEECQERFRHNLIGTWTDADGYMSPAPVTTWEFFANGTGRETIESGSGTLCKEFEWQEDSDFTLRFRDGDLFEDGERGADTDEDETGTELSEPWYTRTYHFEQNDDEPWPTFLLHGIAFMDPLHYFGPPEAASATVPDKASGE